MILEILPKFSPKIPTKFTQNPPQMIQKFTQNSPKIPKIPQNFPKIPTITRKSQNPPKIYKKNPKKSLKVGFIYLHLNPNPSACGKYFHFSLLEMQNNLMLAEMSHI